MNTTILMPAYGKQYATVADAKAAWDKGIDFAIKGSRAGKYCSIRDLPALQYCISTVYIFLPNLGQSFTVSTH